MRSLNDNDSIRGGTTIGSNGKSSNCGYGSSFRHGTHGVRSP